MLLYYCTFYLVEKYPMIISTPRNPYREFAQSSNRSTGTCAPEFTVAVHEEVLLDRLEQFGKVLIRYSHFQLTLNLHF